MTGNGEPGFEAAVRLFLDHIGNDLRGICGRGVLGVEDEFATPCLALVGGEAFAEMFDVSAQHCKIDAFFGSVDGQSTDCKAGHGGDVAGPPALSLDHEDATAGGGSGLLDRIAVADERVEAGVTTDGILGAGNVVADGGGEKDHGDAEGWVFGLTFAHLGQGTVGFEPANDEESIDLPFLEAGRGFCEADFTGEIAIGPNLGPAFADPAFDLEPIYGPNGANGFILMVSHETREAIMDGPRFVTPRKAVCYG